MSDSEYEELDRDLKELALWRSIGPALKTIMEDSQAFLAQLSQKQRDAIARLYELLP
jgi:hypothetical protein